MLINNRDRKREAETRSFTDRLCGKKRFKNFCLNFFRNSRTAVRYSKFNSWPHNLAVDFHPFLRLILNGTGPYSGPTATQRRFRDVLLMISVAAVALAAAIALANAEECRQGSPGAGGAPCTSNVIIGTADTGCGPSQCAKATEAEATTWITANAGALPWDIIDTCQRRYNDTPTAVHARSVANCLCVETKLRLTRKILNGGK